MDGYRVSSSMAGPDMSDFAQRDAFELISKIGNRLQLSAKIVDRAVRLFRQCYESPLRAMCRTQNQSTATACVYVACREEHCPQTFKALTSVSKVDYKVMGQCCQYIVNALGVGWDEMTPEEAVQEFCLRSGFSPMIEMAAQQIARKAILMKLIPGNNALTCAAAAVYLASMASDDQRPVFEFATLTGVGDTTIRSSYNRIVSYARQLFPQSFPFFVPPEHLPLL
jgi:transcription initiation factor TFIIB